MQLTGLSYVLILSVVLSLIVTESFILRICFDNYIVSSFLARFLALTRHDCECLEKVSQYHLFADQLAFGTGENLSPRLMQSELSFSG